MAVKKSRRRFEARPSNAPTGPSGTGLCHYFDAGLCRSCTHLNWPYAKLLSAKYEQTRATLAMIDATAWEAPVGSQRLGFRNKAKLSVGGTTERPILGIVTETERQDLRECPLYGESMRALIAKLPALIALLQLQPYSVRNRRGQLKHIIVTETAEAGGGPAYMVRFVVASKNVAQHIRTHAPQLRAALPEVQVWSVNILADHVALPEGESEIVLGPERHLPVRFGPVELQVQPGAFLQTNPEVATRLYETVARWVGELNPRHVVDAYCGVGGFAWTCAATLGAGVKIDGIEISPAAIAAAQAGSAPEAASAPKFSVGDAAQLLPANIDPGSVDVLIVNPPRRGIGARVSNWINDSGIGYVAYSSCNPQSLAADLRRLSNYRPVRARMFDMFPNTAHVECACLLERVG